MKSTVPFILVAVVTASLAFAAMNYAEGAKSAPASSSVECCDPQAEAAQAH
jgi:hypothetical protein